MVDLDLILLRGRAFPSQAFLQPTDKHKCLPKALKGSMGIRSLGTLGFTSFILQFQQLMLSCKGHAGM